jgi:hypothetical protein
MRTVRTRRWGGAPYSVLSKGLNFCKVGNRGTFEIDQTLQR